MARADEEDALLERRLLGIDVRVITDHFCTHLFEDVLEQDGGTADDDVGLRLEGFAEDDLGQALVLEHELGQPLSLLLTGEHKGFKEVIGEVELAREP